MTQDTPESITEAELAEALAECGEGAAHAEKAQSIVFMGIPRKVAAEIFAEVLGRREPEYEPYEIYEASNGRSWQFYSDEDGQRGWLAPGQVTRYGFDFPGRPLRKMVPEHPHPDHAAILDEIAAWADSGYVFKDLADRICKLWTVKDEH
jgi:hypothetical protein